MYVDYVAYITCACIELGLPVSLARQRFDGLIGICGMLNRRQSFTCKEKLCDWLGANKAHDRT